MTDQKNPGSSGPASEAAKARLSDRVLKGTFWFVGGTIARAALRLVVIASLARLLVPEDFGLVGAASIFVAFAELFSTSGIVYVLVQRIDVEPRHVRSAFTANLVSGIVAGLAIWAASDWIARFFGMPRLGEILPVLALLFPLNSVSAVSQKLLERDLAYGRIAWADLISYVVGYALVSVALAWLGFGVWSLVWAQLGAAAGRSLLLMYYQPHRLRPSLHVGTYLEMMRKGAGYGLVRYALYAAQKGDYFVVGRALGAAALGLYERSYVLMDLSTTLLANALHTVLFPAFSKLQNDRQLFALAYDRVSALVWLTFLPTGVAASLLAPEIIAVLLGSGWQAAVIPFRVLAVGMVFRTGFRVSNIAANGMGVPYRSAAALTVYALFVVIGATLTVRFGIAAVAASTLLALAVAYLLLTRLCLTLSGTSPGKLFSSAVIPALRVTSASALVTILVAEPLRRMGAEPFVTLATSVAAVLTTLGLFVFFRPQFFGAHGSWLIATFSSRASPIRRR